MTNHFLFDEATLDFPSQEMFSCQPVGALLQSGKKFYITNRGPLDDCFLYFSQTGNVEKLRNGDRINTPYTVWDRLMKVPGDGFVFTVNRGTFPTGDLPMAMLRYPVAFPHGRVHTVDVIGSVNASVSCTDSEELIRLYLQEGVSDPMTFIGQQICKYLRGFIGSAINQSMAAKVPLAALQVVENVANASDDLCRELERRLKFIRIQNLALCVEVENAAEIIGFSNEAFEETKALRMRLIDVMAENAKRNLISPETADIIKNYLLTCSVMPQPDELVKLISSVGNLVGSYPIGMVESQLKKMGLLPIGRGGTTV